MTTWLVYTSIHIHNNYNICQVICKLEMIIFVCRSIIKCHNLKMKLISMFIFIYTVFPDECFVSNKLLFTHIKINISIYPACGFSEPRIINISDQ